MIKDLLKTMTGINNDTNLKPNEKVLLSSLILYHNVKEGYAYPTYEHLLVALSTNRRAKVSDTLKSLVAKEYITIKKIRGNKSIYYIHKHLHFVNETANTPVVETQNNKPVFKAEKPVDSNGNTPIKNQIHVDEVISPAVIEIAEYTGFTKEESKELLDEGRGDKSKAIIAFEEMKKKKGVKNPFGYTKWAITNSKVKITTEKVESKFNNFEARSYDYDKLEAYLTGQVEYEDAEDVLRSCMMYSYN